MKKIQTRPRFRFEVEVTESTTETEEQIRSSDSLNPILANKNSLFVTPVGNTTKRGVGKKVWNDFYNLVNDELLPYQKPT